MKTPTNPSRQYRIVSLGATLFFMLMTGCPPSHQTPTGPYSTMTGASQDREESRALADQARSVLETDPNRAEMLLRQALNLDLYNGPAHNNLGILLLNKGNLYEAAAEFEWARKLLPGHPDPRLNLAITLERGGRVDEATDACRTALEVQPEYLPAMQTLALIQVRYNQTDEQTPRMLREIMMRGDSQWRAWARQHADN